MTKIIKVEMRKIFSAYHELKTQLKRTPRCNEFCRRVNITRSKLDSQLGKRWWGSLIKAVGDKQHWSGALGRDRFISDYRQVVSELGRKPSYREYYKRTKHGESSLCEYFGKPGWRSMLAAINETPKRNVDRDKLLADYLNLKEKLNRQPTITEYTKETGHAVITLNNYFGKPGWRNLLKFMGAKPVYRKKLIDREHLIFDYLLLKKNLNRQPTGKEFVKETRHSLMTIIRLFGKPGWRNLIVAAGDTPWHSRSKDINKEHLMVDYFQLKMKLNRQPSYSEFNKETQHSQETLVRIFGRPGWSNLIRAAGDIPAYRGKVVLDRKKLLDDYIALKEKLGKQPSCNEYTKITRHTMKTVARHFGNPPWTNLLKIFGETPLRLRP